MKKLLSLLLALLLLSFAFVSCDSFDTKIEPTEDTEDTQSDENASKQERPKGNSPETSLDNTTIKKLFSTSQEVTNYVLIEVESIGFIVVELLPDFAPETVANFQMLVKNGFYDGLTFHRVIQNFMIQGGDPNGDGTGGSNASIKGEFTANGIDNKLSHKRGVLSMARRSDSYDSASSQFFICHQNAVSLDGQYAAFGEVIYGMDVVDTIASVATDIYNKPQTDVVIKSMKFVTKNESAFPSQPTIPPVTDLFTRSESTTNYVLIDVANFGSIVVELYADVAPETVANFQMLVGNGFYDGLIFHRVIKDFMIQGGDPNKDGTGGSEQSIKGEFSANGHPNSLSHTRGVISMARRSDSYDSASSQFFICHADATYLDGQYAAFGKVTSGMEAVDEIASVPTDYNDRPKIAVRIKKAYMD